MRDNAPPNRQSKQLSSAPYTAGENVGKGCTRQVGRWWVDCVHSHCALWPNEGGAHLSCLLPKETTTTPLKSILSFCQFSISKHAFREKTSDFFLYFITHRSSAKCATHGHGRGRTTEAVRECRGSEWTSPEQPRYIARATRWGSVRTAPRHHQGTLKQS